MEEDQDDGGYAELFYLHERTKLSKEEWDDILEHL